MSRPSSPSAISPIVSWTFWISSKVHSAPSNRGRMLPLRLGSFLLWVVANWNRLPQAAALSAENSSWNTGKMSSGDATRRMAKFRRRRATSV